jgi:hypothetical protein
MQCIMRRRFYDPVNSAKTIIIIIISSLATTKIDRLRLLGITINKVFTVDIYDLLDSFVSWLIERTNADGSKLLSSVSIKNRVINVKNFLEYYDIVIIPHKFRSRVNLPRVYDQDKEALTKNDIIRILISFLTWNK